MNKGHFSADWFWLILAVNIVVYFVVVGLTIRAAIFLKVL